MDSFPIWVKPSWHAKIIVTDPPHGLDDPCWIWTGARTPDGYGRANIGGRVQNGGEMAYLHRFAWEQHHGEKIPPGFDGAHICERSSCFQPTHIKAQLAGENRAASSARRYEREALSADDLAALACRHWATVAVRAAFR